MSCLIEAQQIKIEGRLVDDSSAPVRNATMLVEKSDSSIVAKTITDSTGAFVVAIVPGNYLLIGLKSKQKIYEHSFTFSQDIDLGTLYVEAFNSIKGVTINGGGRIIQQKIDRFVFNVEKSVVSSGGNALDVLNKTPRVRVDAGGGLSIVGKSSIGILINGEKIALSGDQLSEYLKTIPSYNIKSVEVITNPPANYSAEGNSGLINIILKKNAKNTWVALLQSNYRQGRKATDQNDLTLQFRKDKLSITGTYGYNFGTTRYLNYNKITYPTEVWDSKMTSIQTAPSYSGNLSLDYDLSDKATIGGVYNFSRNNGSYTDLNNTSISGNQSLDFMNTGAKRKSSETLNLVNLHSAYKLDKAKDDKISLNFNYLSFNSGNDNIYISNLFKNNDLQQTDRVGDTGSQIIDNYSIAVDAKQSISSLSVEYGAKLSYSKTNNSLDSHELDTDLIPIMAGATKNLFLFKESIFSPYATISTKIGDKLEGKVGVRVESSTMNGKSISTGQDNNYKYTKVFPTAYLLYKLDANNSLSLNYGRRIRRPSFGQLDPFKWYSSPFSYTTGNPDLQPSFMQNIELNYTHKDLTVSSYYSKGSNEFSQIAILNNNDKIQIFAPYNGFSSNNGGVSVNYSTMLTKWWQTDTELDWAYSAYKSVLSFTNSSNKGSNLFFSTDNTFFFGKEHKYAIDISWWLQTKEVSKMDTGTPYNAATIIGKANFFNKKLTVTVTARDIFSSQKQHWLSTSNGSTNDYLFYGDNYHYYGIALTLKLGGKIVKKEHDLDNDVRSRL